MAKQGQLVDPGTYTAKAIASGFGRTSTGKDQIAVKFEITQEGEFKGRHLTWRGFFTEKTRDRTFESLMAAGWAGESLQDMSGLGSQECAIVVDTEPDFEDSSLLRNRVKWVNDPIRLRGGLGLKEELSDSDIGALDSSLKGDLLAWKQSRPQTSDASFNYGANADDDEPPL